MTMPTMMLSTPTLLGMPTKSMTALLKLSTLMTITTTALTKPMLTPPMLSKTRR